MSARRNFEWPELLTADGRGIAFGGDYNPDQWSEDIWDDDIRLMKQAGVNTVALAIFSWDRIDDGSALLASHLPDDLSGRVADFACPLRRPCEGRRGIARLDRSQP